MPLISSSSSDTVRGCSVFHCADAFFALFYRCMIVMLVFSVCAVGPVLSYVANSSNITGLHSGTVGLTTSRSVTLSATHTPTAPRTVTLSATHTPTASRTLTLSATHTPTASRTLTLSATQTPTALRTVTLSSTHTPTASRTVTLSSTHTPTASRTVTLSSTHSPTASRTVTLSATRISPTITAPSYSFSATRTATSSRSISTFVTASTSHEGSNTSTATDTPRSPSDQVTVSFTHVPTASTAATFTMSLLVTYTETGRATATLTQRYVSRSATLTMTRSILSRTETASTTLSTLLLEWPIARTIVLDPSGSAQYVSLPTLFAAGVSSGVPGDGDATIIFALHSDFFSYPLMGTAGQEHIFSCIAFVPFGDTLRNQIDALWGPGSIVSVNASYLTLSLLLDPSLLLPASGGPAVFALRFTPACFVSGRVSHPSEFMIALRWSGGAPQSAAPPVSSTWSPVVNDVVPVATAVFFVSALSVPQGITAVAGLSFARLTALWSTAACAGLSGPLTFAVDPTLTGITESVVAGFFGTVVVLTSTAAAVLIIHVILVVFSWLATHKRETTTTVQYVMGTWAFPGRTAAAFLTVWGYVLESVIVVLGAASNLTALAVTGVCIAFWISYWAALGVAVLRGLLDHRSVLIVNAHAGRRGPLSRASRALTLHPGRWVDSGIAHPSGTSSTSSGRGFTAMYGDLFAQFKGGSVTATFAAVEFTFTTLVVSTAAFATLTGECRGAEYCILVFAALHLLLITIIVRPFARGISGAAHWLISACTVTAAGVAALDHAGTPGDHLSTVGPLVFVGQLLCLLSAAVSLINSLRKWILYCRRPSADNDASPPRSPRAEVTRNIVPGGGGNDSQDTSQLIDAAPWTFHLHQRQQHERDVPSPPFHGYDPRSAVADFNDGLYDGHPRSAAVSVGPGAPLFTGWTPRDIRARFGHAVADGRRRSPHHERWSSVVDMRGDIDGPDVVELPLMGDTWRGGPHRASHRSSP